MGLESEMPEERLIVELGDENLNNLQFPTLNSLRKEFDLKCHKKALTSIQIYSDQERITTLAELNTKLKALPDGGFLYKQLVQINKDLGVNVSKFWLYFFRLDQEL
ncbi:hypothetical protein KC678_01885 [Candidatus Dojkabacteria bacterium]|uniref:Uncharacterized protein n=1 Tax=Candidatus Dojkabacteria bacterium TaxID=2099670 RepID=A0A955L159_9BACT|nr:hypothetical protein [Candidatus Dojkabacteria bacterium]